MLYQVNWSWTPDCEEFVFGLVKGFCLNVCCGLSKIGDVRVDIDRGVKPDLVASVYFLPFVEGSFDTVICDPPFDYLYNDSRLVDCLALVARFKVVVSHPPRNIVLVGGWKKSVWVTEQGTYFLRMWSVFELDKCQFRDKFGVCVGNCSLGVLGVCKSFYIRSSELEGSSEVSYALSKQSKAEVKSDSKRPELTGDVTVGRYQDKKKIGSISLWVQEDSLGTNKPVFLGNVQVGDAKSQVVAWLHGWHLVKD